MCLEPEEFQPKFFLTTFFRPKIFLKSFQAEHFRLKSCYYIYNELFFVWNGRRPKYLAKVKCLLQYLDEIFPHRRISQKLFHCDASIRPKKVRGQRNRKSQVVSRTNLVACMMLVWSFHSGNYLNIFQTRYNRE